MSSQQLQQQAWLEMVPLWGTATATSVRKEGGREEDKMTRWVRVREPRTRSKVKPSGNVTSQSLSDTMHIQYIVTESSIKHIVNHRNTPFQSKQLRFPGTEEGSLHHPRLGHPAGWWQRGPQAVYHCVEPALALPAPNASFPPPHFHIVFPDQDH